MSLLNRFVDEAYSTWLSSAAGCCAPHQLREHRGQAAPIRGIEKPMTILHHQPHLIPPPIPEPQYQSAASRAWSTKTKSVSTRVSFSVKRRVNAYNGIRRPQISGPTDFQHVQNGFPRRTERTFRPLELSIYMPENRLSPLLPHFGAIDEEEPILSYPPPAALMHTRSDSALSNFTIRRKPLGSHSVSLGRRDSVYLPGSEKSSAELVRISKALPPRPDSLSEEELVAALQDELPTPPPMARLRSNTEPSHLLHCRDSEQVQRIKSIMHEKVILEKQLKDLDSIIEERRSIYISSQPASLYAESSSAEPMPSVPSESSSKSNPRPRTAPSRPTVHIPLRSKSFSEASAAFSSPATPGSIGTSVSSTRLVPTIRPHYTESIPPPPLPLVLQAARPPLRKKKSFSRVSNWLFPSNGYSTSDNNSGAEHARNISLDSVTNTPKPITTREGFYQCIDPTSMARQSVDSINTLSTESTLRTVESDAVVQGRALPMGMGIGRGMVTSWTPDSSLRDEGVEKGGLVKVMTFGEGRGRNGSQGSCELDVGHGVEGVEVEGQCRVSRVGVAF